MTDLASGLRDSLRVESSGHLVCNDRLFRDLLNAQILVTWTNHPERSITPSPSQVPFVLYSTLLYSALLYPFMYVRYVICIMHVPI